MTSKDRDLVTLEGASLARRQFLGATGRAGLLALGAPALALGGAAEAYGVMQRSYFGGNYGLVLDGAFAGYLTGFSGGNTVADVVKIPVGADRLQRKRLGSPRVEPLTIECGLPLAKSFLEWIKSSIEPGAKAPLKNGAIVEFDGTLKELGRRNFFNATISEVEFPSCDASSKDPARLTVTFQPEAVTLAAGTGVKPPAAAPARWLRSNFLLKIQGLEQALTHTTEINAVEIKVTSAADSPVTREPNRQPPVIDTANLSITVADTLIGQIYAWHQEFVVKRTGKPRPGILDYLSPDMKSGLLTLNFSNLGIVKVAPEALVAGATSAIRRSRVEMYCDGVTVNYKV